jgi:lysophospholipase L1-like esterase
MKRLVALHFGEDASFQMSEGDCDYLICNRAMKDIEGKNLSKRRNQYRAFLKKNNDIKVVDVSSEMVNEYKENSAYSYGFSNSAPGEGHLNTTGHRIVAEAVYKCINEMEATK